MWLAIPDQAITLQVKDIRALTTVAVEGSMQSKRAGSDGGFVAAIHGLQTRSARTSSRCYELDVSDGDTLCLPAAGGPRQSLRPAFHAMPQPYA